MGSTKTVLTSTAEWAGGPWVPESLSRLLEGAAALRRGFAGAVSAAGGGAHVAGLWPMQGSELGGGVKTKSKIGLKGKGNPVQYQVGSEKRGTGWQGMAWAEGTKQTVYTDVLGPLLDGKGKQLATFDNIFVALKIQTPFGVWCVVLCSDPLGTVGVIVGLIISSFSHVYFFEEPGSPI